jgi:hypothetical protein
MESLSSRGWMDRAPVLSQRLIRQATPIPHNDFRCQKKNQIKTSSPQLVSSDFTRIFRLALEFYKSCEQVILPSTSYPLDWKTQLVTIIQNRTAPELLAPAKNIQIRAGVKFEVRR